MISILGICGSPFVEGNTAMVLNAAMNAGLSTDVKVRTIYVPENFPRNDGRRDEEKYDLDTRVAMLTNRGQLRNTVKAILAADAVIFATPTRCFNMEPRILDLFSWLMVTCDFPDYALTGKIAGFMSVCEEDGAQSANEKMMSAANHLGFAIPPHCSYFYNKFAKKSEGNWQTTGRAKLGKTIVKWARAAQNLIDDD